VAAVAAAASLSVSCVIVHPPCERPPIHPDRTLCSMILIDGASSPDQMEPSERMTL
ncbi:unnamed protein product, partial [Acidocella sp. C78]